MFTKYAPLALAAAALAGCSSSSDGPVGPAVGETGSFAANVTVAYDEAGDRITISNGTSRSILERNSSLDSGDFKSYQVNRSFAHRAETASGSGTVMVVVSRGTEYDSAGTIFERLSDTDVPGSGSATYSGSYVGLLANAGDKSLTDIISGDVILIADFAAGTMSGAIINRAGFSPGTTATDVTLHTATLADGAFSGTTSGGDYDVFSTTANPGTYEGLLTGPNGEEVVGGVLILHDSPTNTYVEVGGYVAD